MQRDLICRPRQLTCRWIFEITSAIENITLSPRINQCIKGHEQDTWDSYLNRFYLNQHASQNPNVVDILQYKEDYLIYLNKKKKNGTRLGEQ